METWEIVLIVVLYLFAGLITFIAIWDEIETGTDIKQKPRHRRICIRVAAILIWPWIWVAAVYVSLKRTLGWLWELLTE